jgi:integrase
MARISKRVVDAARRGKRPAFIWDSTLPGFALLTLPTGAKSYVYQFRTAEGLSRRGTLAKVGAVTPAEARTLAEKWSSVVKAGGDPLKIKHEQRDALTVAGLLDRYIESAHYATKTSKVQQTGRGEIERHLKPLLGRRIAAKVEPDDIKRIFAQIRDGKTAKTVKTGFRGLARVRGGEGVARHAMRLLRAAFRWAKAERLIERDPSEGINFGRDGEREMVLDGEHYARLFATLAKMESERRLRPAVADAVRIIAMTGARRGEVAGLRWRDVDMKGGRIVLTRHKTVRSSGKPRVINLPAAAQEIITRQHAGRPDAFVFVATGGTGPVQLAKPWRSIRREARLPDDTGLHTLRHSVASALAVGGAGAPEIMQALGHRQLATVARYLHFADAARAALAERAALPALAGMAAASGAPKAPVVALPHRKRP